MSNRKKCKPSKKVSDAGKKLATSKSEKVKSESAKILKDHQDKKH